MLDLRRDNFPFLGAKSEHFRWNLWVQIEKTRVLFSKLEFTTFRPGFCCQLELKMNGGSILALHKTGNCFVQSNGYFLLVKHTFISFIHLESGATQ